MRKTKNIAEVELPKHEFEKESAILWDEFDGRKRKSVFDYSSTRKDGVVKYRERIFNITSRIF